MKKAGIDFSDRHALLGHKSNISNDLNYDRTEDSDRLLAYVKAIPLLTIDPTQRLEKENQDLKIVQTQEIDKLKSKLSVAEERNKQIEKTADDAIRLAKTLLEDFESYTKTGHHKPGIKYDFT
jgi:hypothetical protein